MPQVASATHRSGMTFVRLLAAGVAVLGIACGSSSPTAPQQAPLGRPGQASPDGADPTTHLQYPGGRVSVERSVSGVDVVANFMRADSASCQLAAAGSCLFRACQIPSSSSSGSAPTAGALTFTVRGKSLQDAPDAAGAYSQGLTSVLPLYSAGDIVHFAGAGADVAAFDVDVPAPADLVFDAVSTPVDRSQPLVLHWSGGGAGYAGALILSIPDPKHATFVQCSAPASAGSMTIPPEALASLDPGDQSLVLSSYNAVSITAGAFTPVATVFGTAKGTNGGFSLDFTVK
jgi:hypothetical protein